jgi:hypothetical protein
MPTKLPVAIKSLVIQQWLQGSVRDKIAAENDLSAGAVTNIISEWKQALGIPIADDLRELAVTLNKVGISATQCASGFRIASIMQKMGVTEDNFESFIVDIYNRCNNLGLTPENISLYIQDLLEFAKTIPFSQIPEYITKKADEKKKLEEQIEQIRNEKEILEEEKTDIEFLRDKALQDQEITNSDLKWYSKLKEELLKYGIPIEDILQFSKIVDGIRQYGYDPDKVVNAFSDVQSLIVSRNHLQERVQSLGTKVNDLNKQCSSLELRASFHSQAINAYENLQVLGVGLKELNFLRNTIMEIADANDIPASEAVEKFYRDIEEQYDSKLGFESKVQILRDEVNRLNQQLSIGFALAKLVQSGVKEQDIIDVASIIERYSTGGVSGGGSSSSSSSSSAERRSLIAELEKYDSIKSAIGKLTQKAEKLTNEVSSLQAQKQDLQIQNQTAISSLIASSRRVDFLNGQIYSLKNEIMRLFSISAFALMIYLMRPQFHDLRESQLNSDDDASGSGGAAAAGLDNDDNEDEFAPLIKARKGEYVPISEVKKGVTKAIELMLSKLYNDNNTTTTGNANDRLIAALYNARLTLMDRENS